MIKFLLYCIKTLDSLRVKIEALSMPKSQDNRLLFRINEGGFDESLQTVIEITSYEHLIDYISSQFNIIFHNLTILPYEDVSQNNWDKFIVIIDLGLNTIPIGFLNRKPPGSIEDYEHE